MARVLITVTTVTHDGVDYPTAQASDPTNDHEIDENDAATILILENQSGSSRTVVIQTGETFGDPAIPLLDRTITLAVAPAAGFKKVAGPFSRRLFNQTGDAGDQSVLVDIDGGASDVEIVALSVPIPVA